MLLLCVYVCMVGGVAGCQSRSGEDGERLNSHQGTEPSYQKDATDKVEAEHDVLAEDENREREDGEIKVGKKWEFPVAQTKVGNLWGTVEESRSGKRVLAFRGIRHVQPPVGPLRFRPPVFAPKREGIVEAKTNGHMCPQHLATKPDIWVGDEDCLWLNVFTR